MPGRSSSGRPELWLWASVCFGCSPQWRMLRVCLVRFRGMLGVNTERERPSGSDTWLDAPSSVALVSTRLDASWRFWMVWVF